MTIVEKNIRKWADELGLKDKYKKEGIKEGIEKGDKQRQLSVSLKMLKKGFSIEDIMDTTELSREEVQMLRGDR